MNKNYNVNRYSRYATVPLNEVLNEEQSNATGVNGYYHDRNAYPPAYDKNYFINAISNPDISLDDLKKAYDDGIIPRDNVYPSSAIRWYNEAKRQYDYHVLNGNTHNANTVKDYVTNIKKHADALKAKIESLKPKPRNQSINVGTGGGSAGNFIPKPKDTVPNTNNDTNPGDILLSEKKFLGFIPQKFKIPAIVVAGLAAVFVGYKIIKK